MNTFVADGDKTILTLHTKVDKITDEEEGCTNACRYENRLDPKFRAPWYIG